jgi:hypothetical protein
LKGKRAHFKTTLRNVILPMALVASAAGIVTGIYFWRVTGNPRLMPYVLHNQIYGMPPPLIVHSPVARVEHRHKYLAELYDVWAARHLESRTLRGAIDRNVRKFRILWPFYLAPALSLPLVFLPWTIRDRRIRPLLVVLAVMLAVVMVELTTWPHYLAPFVGAIVAVVLQSVRHLRSWTWRRRPSGRFIARGLPLVVVTMLVLRILAGGLRLPYSSEWDPWYYLPPHDELTRANIVAQLRGSAGPHLVFVRNGIGHIGAREWVYNGADIDASTIVWARDMGIAQNAALIRYYPNRQVWLVEPDKDTPQLRAYRSDDLTNGR